MERRLNLDLFEGIIIGIYTNLLIYIVGKINFETLHPIYLVMLFASFLAFTIYFGFQLLSEQPMTSLKLNFLLIILHLCGWYLPYNSQEPTIEKAFFTWVGIFLFLALYSTEKKRNREKMEKPLMEELFERWLKENYEQWLKEYFRKSAKFKQRPNE